MNHGSVHVSWGLWAGEYGFSTLGLDCILVYLLSYYLFILGKKAICSKIEKLHNFQIVKLESHSEELGLLKLSTSWLHPTRSMKYPLTLGYKQLGYKQKYWMKSDL